MALKTVIVILLLVGLVALGHTQESNESEFVELEESKDEETSKRGVDVLKRGLLDGQQECPKYWKPYGPTPGCYRSLQRKYFYNIVPGWCVGSGRTPACPKSDPDNAQTKFDLNLIRWIPIWVGQTDTNGKWVDCDGKTVISDRKGQSCVIMHKTGKVEFVSCSTKAGVICKILPKDPNVAATKAPLADKPLTGLSPTQEASILKKHNDLRRSVKAVDMPDLVWDKELAAVAQEWANGCEFVHSKGLKTKQFQRFGENIYLTSITKASGVDLDEAVQMWYDEVKDYDITTNKCNPGKVCGHYTQMVWASTKHLGCGVRSCIKNLKTPNPKWTSGTLVVCNYGKAGNGWGGPYKPKA